MHDLAVSAASKVQGKRSHCSRTKQLLSERCQRAGQTNGLINAGVDCPERLAIPGASPRAEGLHLVWGKGGRQSQAWGESTQGMAGQ